MNIDNMIDELEGAKYSYNEELDRLLNEADKLKENMSRNIVLSSEAGKVDSPLMSAISEYSQVRFRIHTLYSLIYELNRSIRPL